MQYARNGGVELAYEVEGQTDTETVVFVEGLAYGSWMWRWQREVLREDYRLLVWDNRGTGDSAEPEGPYTTEEMAEDLEAVLDDAGVERAHVVGASLGGMIAQQYVVDYDRAESLTLLCTTPGGDDAVPIPDETKNRMLNVPDDYGPHETIQYKMRPAFSESFWEEHPDLVDRIVDWRLETDPSDAAYEWQAAAATAFDMTDHLDEIRVPTLVIHGREDRVVPFENGRLLHEGLPDATFEPIDGGSHLVFIEQPDRVNDAISSFLDDV